MKETPRERRSYRSSETLKKESMIFKNQNSKLA
jgi:hypothetical protein